MQRCDVISQCRCGRLGCQRRKLETWRSPSKVLVLITLQSAAELAWHPSKLPSHPLSLAVVQKSCRRLQLFDPLDLPQVLPQEGTELGRKLRLHCGLVLRIPGDQMAESITWT